MTARPLTEQTRAELVLLAERVLQERRRFGQPSTRHFAIRAGQQHLRPLVDAGQLTPAQATEAAIRAVVAAETSTVRAPARGRKS